jgi:polar amino acid transport system permease protein
MPTLFAAYSFDWGVFWQYLWPPTALENPLIRDGLVVTIVMAVCAQALGVVIGVVAGVGQSAKFAPVRYLFKTYIFYFRGTPLTIQLALLYYGSAALGLYSFPELHIGSITISGLLQAGIIGLAVNEGAYMAEIVRAGVLGVDKGQSEAAKAIGMRHTQTMRFIVLPQAARMIVPPLGNEFNQMLKSTTLVVILGGAELFNAFQQINSRVFKPFELFLACSFYFLAMTAVWGWAQKKIEQRLDPPGRAQAAAQQTGFAQRLLTGRRVSVGAGPTR